MKKNKDGHAIDNRQTGKHMDNQRQTIIPCHYCVARYKK